MDVLFQVQEPKVVCDIPVNDALIIPHRPLRVNVVPLEPTAKLLALVKVNEPPVDPKKDPVPV